MTNKKGEGVYCRDKPVAILNFETLKKIKEGEREQAVSLLGEEKNDQI